MQRILLVEDSEEFQLLIKSTLDYRFDVMAVSSASEALAEIKKGSFDLFLLDVSLPDKDGFQLCTQLRNRPDTRDVPTIFITGRGAITDKALGFSLGADDYIVKPFEPLELKIRVEAKLDKLRMQKDKKQEIRKGDLKLNLASQRAYLKEKGKERELMLTPNEFKILWFLASREENVFSRDQILNAVWGDGVYIVDRTIDKHIWSLRKKLGNREGYIQTVAGSGYRFSSSARRSGSSSGSQEEAA